MPKFRVHLMQQDVEEATVVVEAATRAEAMDIARIQAWSDPDAVDWKWTETGTLSVVDAVEVETAGA